MHQTTISIVGIPHLDSHDSMNKESPLQFCNKEINNPYKPKLPHSIQCNKTNFRIQIIQWTKLK
jgi:hypothetical protein